MEFIIKQNRKSVSLDSFDKQYHLFNRERLNLEATGRLFDVLDFILLEYDSNKEFSFLIKRMIVQNHRAIPAKDISRCLIAWAVLTSPDDDELASLNFVKPVIDFLNSLDNTTFYFSF